MECHRYNHLVHPWHHQDKRGVQGKFHMTFRRRLDTTRDIQTLSPLSMVEWVDYDSMDQQTFFSIVLLCLSSHFD
jgi:hypothetical protein